MSSSSQLTGEMVTFLETSNVAICISGLFYGIYFVVTMMATYLLLRENSVSDSLLSRRILLCITLFMFIVDSGNFGALVASYGYQIRALGALPSSALSHLNNLAIALIVLARINYVIGDGIVIWRAFILFYKRNRLFCGLLGAGFVASIVSMCIDGVLAIKDVILAAEMTETDTIRRIILPCILFATNFVATMFIASTTWELRRNVELSFYRQSSRGKRVEWILCLLVESGFLYCAIWVMVLIDVVNHIPTRAADILGAIVPHLTGIYPTLIIIIVAAQKSHCQTTLQEDSIIRTTCLDMEEV